MPARRLRRPPRPQQRQRAAPAASAAATPSNTSPAATSGQAKQSSAAKSSGDGNPTNLQDIVGKVTALSKTVPNAWLITLDNGQVWRQTYPEVYPLKPGERVTLRPSNGASPFGSLATGRTDTFRSRKCADAGSFIRRLDRRRDFVSFNLPAPTGCNALSRAAASTPIARLVASPCAA